MKRYRFRKDVIDFHYWIKLSPHLRVLKIKIEMVEIILGLTDADVNIFNLPPPQRNGKLIYGKNSPHYGGPTHSSTILFYTSYFECCVLYINPHIRKPYGLHLYLSVVYTSPLKRDI